MESCSDCIIIRNGPRIYDLISPAGAEFSDLTYSDGKVGAFGNKGLFILVRDQIVEIAVLEKGVVLLKLQK